MNFKKNRFPQIIATCHACVVVVGFFRLQCMQHLFVLVTCIKLKTSSITALAFYKIWGEWASIFAHVHLSVHPSLHPSFCPQGYVTCNPKNNVEVQNSYIGASICNGYIASNTFFLLLYYKL